MIRPIPHNYRPPSEVADRSRAHWELIRGGDFVTTRIRWERDAMAIEGTYQEVRK